VICLAQLETLGPCLSRLLHARVRTMHVARISAQRLLRYNPVPESDLVGHCEEDAWRSRELACSGSAALRVQLPTWATFETSMSFDVGGWVLP
jgi:hypothetical protein